MKDFLNYPVEMKWFNTLVNKADLKWNKPKYAFISLLLNGKAV